MQLNDATRIIDVIDQRVAKHTASNARVETTWGTVAAVSADGRYADLYLYGQSAPYTSDYFRLPNGLSVNVGSSVKAAIDKERGDRWIEEVHTFPAYNKVEFGIENGVIRFGSGTGPVDVNLYRGGADQLKTDDSLVVGGTLSVKTGTNSGDAIYVGNDSKLVDVDIADTIGVQGQQNAANGGIVFGSAKDTNLYRSGANELRTDDLFVSNGNSVYGGSFTLRRYALATDAQPTFAIENTNGELRWGAGGASIYDTNLYRAGADILKTDDRLDSASFFRSERAAVNSTHFQGAIAGDSVPRLDIITDVSGRPTVRFSSGAAAADASIYRSGAAALAVTGALAVSGQMSWGSLAAAHKRGKWVKLATYEQAIADGTTYTAAQTAITGREMTNLPTNAKAVMVTVYVRGTSTGQGSWQALDFGNTHIAAIAYYDAAQFSQYNTSSGIAELGGTNNRQIKFTLSYTAGTVTVYARVTHYYTEED